MVLKIYQNGAIFGDLLPIFRLLPLIADWYSKKCPCEMVTKRTELPLIQNLERTISNIH